MVSASTRAVSAHPHVLAANSSLEVEGHVIRQPNAVPRQAKRLVLEQVVDAFVPILLGNAGLAREREEQRPEALHELIPRPVVASGHRGEERAVIERASSLAAAMGWPVRPLPRRSSAPAL